MQYTSKPLLFLMAVGLLSMIGCSKPSELGLTLVELNPSDVIYSDTLSLEMATVDTDPLPTDERSRWICGTYIDPIFGQISATLYTNFRLVNTNVTFPGASFDSLILTLAYDSIGHYGGNLNAPAEQTWEVYRLEEEITPGQSYYANASFATGAQLATKTFTPRIKDSVSIQGVNRRPHLRIRLDDALGQNFMQPDSSVVYTNNTKFKEYFKGVVIRPAAAAQNSTVLRFLPTSSQTKLTLFYTDSSGTAKSFDYLTDNDAESVLNFTHDYLPTEVLHNKPQDTIVYLQGMNGSSVRIAFPYLSNLGKVIVNKAELYIYVVGEEERDFPIPDQLFALERTNDGEFLLLDDIVTSFGNNSFNPYAQFGGTLKYDGSIRYFRMNISEFFQRLTDGETDENAIYIQTAAVTDSERMLIGNHRSSTLKAKLYLTYTKTN
jgi:hypothetical protein